MKTSVLILFILIFDKAICFESESDSLVSEAINQILTEYFAKSSRDIDLIYCGEIFEKYETLVDEILRKKTDSLRVQLWKSEVWQPSVLELKVSTFLIFESVKVFKEVAAFIDWQPTRKASHPHLVHISGASIKDLQDNIKNGFSIDNVAFIIQQGQKSIELVSSFMYTPQKCQTNQFLTINTFSRKSMKWNNSEFYPKKYQSFHSCPLNIWVPEEENFPGWELDITKALSKSLNFTVKFGLPNPRDRYGLVQRTQYLFTERFHGAFDISAPLLCYDVAFLIPPGEPLTQLEKMFLMFDWEVWVAIGVTFTLSLVTIQVINRMSRKVQNLVFGRDIQTPTLNVANIFLCGAQTRIPRERLARFLLVLFVIWSLIIRTCYQSMLYQYLQADLRQPEVRTVDELIEKLTIYRQPTRIEERNNRQPTTEGPLDDNVMHKLDMELFDQNFKEFKA